MLKIYQFQQTSIEKTLEPLGYKLRFGNEYAASFGEPRGSDPAGDFWLDSSQVNPCHFAFNAKTH